ncbi:hypothetical protein FRC01_004290 [Tulasnella sp. 417]|nr:hypothetical protein FRC01_004290 [Tulasnella sp. 417]
METEQQDLQTLLTDLDLPGDRDESTRVSLATRAIGLATAMDSILDIIGAIERRLPHNLPSTATCLSAAMNKQNSFLPIHKLPTEVLVKIIRLAASERELDWRTGALIDPNLLKNLSRLSLVCHFWRTTIDEERSLWAFLAADTRSLRPLKVAVAKSAGVPVVITSGRNQMPEQEFASAISPLIHCCRVLCLLSTEQWRKEERVYELVKQPSPMLEELYFEGTRQGFTGWERTSPNGPPKPGREKTEIWALENSPERLRVLRLRHVDWFWASLTLSNLRDLKLSFMRISAPELLEFILGAPRVESVYVEQLTEDWTVDAGAPLAQPAPLSSLRRIQMQDGSMAFAHHILSNISPLLLEHIVLTTRSFTNPVPFTEHARHYQRPLCSLAAEQPAGFATLRVGPDNVQLLVRGSDKNREVHLLGMDLATPTHREEFARWLSDLWAPVDPKRPLKIALGRWGIIQATIVPLHRGLVSSLLAFDNVSELHIGFQVDGVHHLYDLLSRPVISHDGKQAWGFPKLEVLLVEGQSQSGESLIKMLEARYNAMASYRPSSERNLENSSAMAVPPSRLQELHVIHQVYAVPSWMADQDEALKRIVGDEHFVVEVEEPRIRGGNRARRQFWPNA